MYTYKGMDLTGKRFGRLVVQNDTTKLNIQGGYKWKCKCDCGNITFATGNHLIGGDVKSCGCLAKELRKASIHKRMLNDEAKKTQKINSGTILGTKALALTQKLKSTNTSGVKGVYFNKSKGKWQSEIVFKGKYYYLGRYESLEEAAQARKIAEDKIFGDFLDWYNTEFKKLPKEKQEEMIK